MGPRHLSRGIQGESGEENRIDPSFNGATAFEPWNRLRSGNCPLLATCFNGATAFEPWNQPRSLGPRSRVSDGFNGATAFEPWNLRRGHWSHGR